MYITLSKHSFHNIPFILLCSYRRRAGRPVKNTEIYAEPVPNRAISTTRTRINNKPSEAIFEICATVHNYGVFAREGGGIPVDNAVVEFF